VHRCALKSSTSTMGRRGSAVTCGACF